jgi:hypothetical protein
VYLPLKVMASKGLFELCEQSFETRQEMLLVLTCYGGENETK